MGPAGSTPNPPDARFQDLDGHWYTVFTLHHRHSFGALESFKLEDPALQGDLPVTPEDLDRVITRAREMEAWPGRFESVPGNPLSAVATVAAWPEGDASPCPRLVTAYWAGPGLDPGEMREAASALLERFQAKPLACPVIQDADEWVVASRELFFDPEE
ncbi:MAG TPA: hypothetical protein VK188_12285 [Holophaga sp.]|nr:hypothetical protein [Holophaga sp.]